MEGGLADEELEVVVGGLLAFPAAEVVLADVEEDGELVDELADGVEEALGGAVLAFPPTEEGDDALEEERPEEGGTILEGFAKGGVLAFPLEDEDTEEGGEA